MSDRPASRFPGLRAERLVAVPVVLAVATALWALAALPARAADEGPAPTIEQSDLGLTDDLGYVVDRADLDDPELVAEGERLYSVACVSCHLPGGVGGERGPTLIDVGAASAHFYLTSGRMPQATEGQAERKPPAYPPEDIAALIAYVASLGDGPEIPDVDLASADLQHGGELYRLNCAACHQAAGAGGALSYGNNAPTLVESTPVQVVEAMLVGPGQMPVFDQLSPADRDAIARYVVALREVPDPGGLSLGRVGPIPEGFVAIIVGTGATLLVATWIGRRNTGHAAPVDDARVEAT